MDSMYEKTEMLLGKEKTDKLKHSAVIIFGLGGVGSYAAEALARCGVGKIGLVDRDVIAASNINRQLYALHSTIGEEKTAIARARIKDINPDCTVICRTCRVDGTNAEDILADGYDFIIDAVDDVEGKLAIIKEAQKKKIPVISAMGAANKTDAAKLKIADIYKTDVCPLAKSVRKRCREEGIAQLACVYSSEEPIRRTASPSSLIFVPAAAGLLLARYVVMHMTNNVNILNSDE